MNRLGLLVVLVASVAEARPIPVRVFDDVDGDGKPGKDEPGVPAAVVSISGTRQYVVTNSEGLTTLEGEGGIAWVRVPSGFRPGPVWARLDGASRIDLALHRWSPPPGPLTFVAASDSHSSFAHPFWSDLEPAAFAATQGEPPPAFFTILGDITQNTTPAQFVLQDRLLANLEVTYVPVPGNHDWYDSGTAWRAHYGPENYSFDIGDVHFVIWNMMMQEEETRQFFANELAQVAPDLTIVAMTHGPPSPAVITKLRELGVDYVLSGHTHTNRIVDHGGMLELNHEPMLMGGLDFTPAGYRIITIDRGVMTSEHRTTVDKPSIRTVAPAHGQCQPPGGGPIIAVTEIDPRGGSVTVRVDCGTPISLSYAGGWNWRGSLPALAPGAHSLTLDAITSDGDHISSLSGVEVCTPESGSLAGIEWPQLGGNPAHTGALASEVAPPLVARWTATAGGHVMHGAPAIAHGLVYLTTTDLANGDGGGVIALDLETGALRWRAPTTLPIRGAATVAGDIVSVVQVDGTTFGFDATSGTERWRYELGMDLTPKAAATYGSIVADAGDLIVGNQRRLATIDAVSGQAVWVRDPVRGNSEFPSLSTIAVGDGVAVGVFDRELGGILAWDRVGAELLWNLTGWDSWSINASPVISGGLVYISNGATEINAFDLLTGERRWRTKLDPNGYDWAIATIGTPAIANGVLVVPTLWRDLVGLDAASGRVLWRFGASGASELRTTHYFGSNERGFAASPVITGDIVWAADTGGHLVALNLHTGSVLWRALLDVPVLAGLATNGAALIVASYDGTVRALAPAPRERPAVVATSCEVPPSAGCCDARAHAGGPWLLGSLVALALYRRRRRSRPIRPRPSTAPNPDAPPALHA